ncbi:MAG: hypothetical protein GX442_02120 [Candidatus Riflebacteria bacterium]|nr:hypothetical protein [Candidatus Riflebacteria bacterium]
MKSGSRVTFVILLLIGFALFWWGIFLPNSHAAYDGPVTQIRNACFAGSRALQETVEMYDMDHATAPMKVLDIPLLQAQGYLRSEPHGCDPDCRFRADLLASPPQVWCEKHGNAEHPTALTLDIIARETSLWGRFRTRLTIFLNHFR